MRRTDLFAVVFICASLLLPAALKAGEEKVDYLRQSITASTDESALFDTVLDGSNGFYKDARFDEFLTLLTSIDRKDKAWSAVNDYFFALTRYKQLAQLEQSQQWEQYFNQGSAYREEIGQRLERSLKESANKDQVNISARLLSLQMTFDQTGPAAEAVTAFVDAAKKYAEAAKDFGPLKSAADMLMSNNEKRAAKELYKVYLEKTTSAGMPDADLVAMAKGFLKDGNIDFSESAYDIYLKRLQTYPKEKAVPALFEVAAQFAFKDKQVNDPYFAEKVFALAEASGGEDAFDAGNSYLRAFNLERSGEFPAAKDRYLALVKRFPDSGHVLEARFKAAVICAFAQKDLASAREQFELLSKKEPAAPESISALYQLGLLKQWEKDNEAARAYYSQAVEKAGTGYPETTALCQQRLQEIAAGKELDYPVKSFLDASLGSNPADMSKAQVEAGLAGLKQGDEESFSGIAQPGESGCTQVILSYLWSGDLGAASPDAQQNEFKTSYKEPGTKLVTLVVMSPTGLLDRAITMINVE